MLNLDGVSHNMYLHQIGSNNQINIKTIKYDTKQGNGMHIHEILESVVVESIPGQQAVH